MVYQKIKQLIINILNLYKIYEYVRNCNNNCSETIQYFEKVGSYECAVGSLKIKTANCTLPTTFYSLLKLFTGLAIAAFNA